MAALADLVPRRAQSLVSEALEDTRVVLVNDARQAGKSTLTRLAAQDRPGTVVRLLDDAATLRAAQDDPAGFVEHDGLMVIDEVQLAPELLRAIKVIVDTDPRPGRFLLTGSSRVLALRSLPDALPGRMEVIELWPYSGSWTHETRNLVSPRPCASSQRLHRRAINAKVHPQVTAVRRGYLLNGSHGQDSRIFGLSGVPA